ncbi:MAG: hypothetical protein Kow0019_00990 [Methanobacteriaceae archaeon]
MQFLKMLNLNILSNNGAVKLIDVGIHLKSVIRIPPKTSTPPKVYNHQIVVEEKNNESFRNH